MSYFCGFSVSQRLHAVQVHRYCSNCLSQLHQLRYCSSNVVCRTYGRRHHSLLHSYQGDRSTTQSYPRRSVQDRLQLPNSESLSHQRLVPAPTVRRLQWAPRRDNTTEQNRRSECSEETDSGIVPILISRQRHSRRRSTMFQSQLHQQAAGQATTHELLRQMVAILELIWIPEYHIVRGNKKADYCNFWASITFKIEIV